MQTVKIRKENIGPGHVLWDSTCDSLNCNQFTQVIIFIDGSPVMRFYGAQAKLAANEMFNKLMETGE